MGIIGLLGVLLWSGVALIVAAVLYAVIAPRLGDRAKTRPRAERPAVFSAMALGMLAVIVAGTWSWSIASETSKRYDPAEVLSKVRGTEQQDLASWSTDDLNRSDESLKKRQDELGDCKAAPEADRPDCVKERLLLELARAKLYAATTAHTG
ncbi:hypothetical protein [Arthrobacter sp. NPDC090010]|uniref:hypothetical protein n=1 Tax=Arthrobacter sp. NPDC090010 TaxID=3363942 RepID=UPI00382AE918